MQALKSRVSLSPSSQSSIRGCPWLPTSGVYIGCGKNNLNLSSTFTKLRRARCLWSAHDVALSVLVPQNHRCGSYGAPPRACIRNENRSSLRFTCYMIASAAHRRVNCENPRQMQTLLQNPTVQKIPEPKLRDSTCGGKGTRTLFTTLLPH